uniref:DUF1230 family protein n=1 Tax=Auxenochlorella protothecoides TaxID=3075 RepID=A0A1D2A2R1_AUXPR
MTGLLPQAQCSAMPFASHSTIVRMECRCSLGCTLASRSVSPHSPSGSGWSHINDYRVFRSTAPTRLGRAWARRDDVSPGPPMGPDSRLETPVPREQRPVNQLKELKESPLLTWATLDGRAYQQRFLLLYASLLGLLAAPIAAQTFDPGVQPLEFALSASIGATLVVAVVSFRLYITWKYVCDRLLSASVDYEESGWYDGQIFVKPPEVLARDRLLGMYEVRPVLRRLRITLQVLGASLAASSLALALLTRQ